MISNLKSFLKNTVKALRERDDREYEMSFNRFIFIFLIGVYVTCLGRPGWEAGLAYIGCYAAFATVTLVSVIKSGARNDFRRIIALIGDFTTISFEIHVCDDMTAVFLPIYLWVVFGNGFRFGVRFLALSAVVANVSFLVMAATTKFWQDHAPLTVGCQLGLIVLPAYVSTLIRKLSTTTEQAQAANKAKTMFLAGVSHELRTPLHTITNAAVLLDHTALDEEQRELTTTVVNSSRYLHGLLGDILDLSRMEANVAQLDPCPTDIAELLVEAQSMSRLPAREKGLDLRLQVSPRLPEVGILDRKMVLQVLMNLMSNALKFTEAGHVTLAALPGPAPGTIHLAVSDTGIGIAEDALSRIFGSFVQADKKIIDRFGGTGLGLAIAKRLVKTMNGSIDVESTPGKGSCFRIVLPMAKASAPDRNASNQSATVVIVGQPVAVELQERLGAIGMQAQTAETLEHGVEMVLSAREAGKTAYIAATSAKIDEEGESPVTAALLRDMGGMLLTPTADAMADRGDTNCLPTYISPSSTPEQLRAAFRVITTLVGGKSVESRPVSPVNSRALNILVADDNLVNRKIMAKILSNRGHRSSLVANGEDALDILERDSFDLILMDVNMPALNGIDATKMYRFMEPHGKRTPILALTADATREMANRCLEAGMDGVVTKPIEPDKILSMIESYVSPEGGKAALATKAAPAQLAFDVVLPVLDKKTQDGLRRLGGEDFAHEVSVQFLGDAIPLLVTLRAASERHDIEQYRFDAHAIRSSARNVGAKAVAEFAEAAEALQEDAFDRDAMRLVARVEIELKRLQRELDATAPASRAGDPVAGQ